MKASHAAAIKAQAAAETVETLRRIEERLVAIEKMLLDNGAGTIPIKKIKKVDAAQTASPQPEKA